MKKIFILSLVLFVVGSVTGYVLARDRYTDIPDITATSIVEQMQKEGFLVTQSLVLQEDGTIEKKSGNALKDFFLGQRIDAQATLKVDRGVDLTKIAQDDILLTEQTVRVRLPAVETRSVELLGGITLANDQGIIKKIFDNEDGYNEAIILLQEQARSAAEAEEFSRIAKTSSEEQMQRILRLMGITQEIIFVY